MEVTRKRHTPENMLIILKEIEGLCDKGQLVPKNCRPTIPAIYNILMVLMDKGVVSKKIGKYTWTGGKPNIYMAKEVIKENQKYQFELLEKRVERERNTKKYLSETIDSTQINDIPELELYEPIKEEVVDIKEDYLSALQDFKEDLKEANAEIIFLKQQNKELLTNNSLLLDSKEDFKKQLAEYELDISDLLKENGELKYQIDKTQEVRQEKKSKQRKVKFLGITIFKID